MLNLIFQTCLVPAFDYCSSFKSLLTGKVLISKKSCFNEGEMLIANTKKPSHKIISALPLISWRFKGEKRKKEAHLCVYTLRRRLLLFYHNISLKISTWLSSEKSILLSLPSWYPIPPQRRSHSKRWAYPHNPGLMTQQPIFFFSGCPKKHLKNKKPNQTYAPHNFSLQRNHLQPSSPSGTTIPFCFLRLWSFTYHIICAVIIVFARELCHLRHNTQSWHGGKKSYYRVTSGCQHLFSEIYEIAAMKRHRLLDGTHIAEAIPGAASLGTRGLSEAVVFAVSATSVRGGLHLWRMGDVVF